MNTPTPINAPPPPPAPRISTPAATPVPTDHPVMSAIPWYQSPIVIAQVSATLSGLVAIAPKNTLIQSLGWTDPHAVNDSVTAIFAGIAVLASLVGAIARVRSKIQPLTLTQVGAELHPNSLAVQQSQGSQPKS